MAEKKDDKKCNVEFSEFEKGYRVEITGAGIKDKLAALLECCKTSCSTK